MKIKHVVITGIVLFLLLGAILWIGATTTTMIYRPPTYDIYTFAYSQDYDLTVSTPADRTYSLAVDGSIEIDKVLMNFSSAESRDITFYLVYGSTSIKLYEETGDTSLNYVVDCDWKIPKNCSFKIITSTAPAACSQEIMINYYQ